MLTFPNLTAQDVEARVGQCSDKGCSLLLYKDARCDMRILDEALGAENWQCHYDTIDGKLFCTVSVWNGTQWVEKQDVGVPSNMESEKGEASDAFKRSCFKWGIGRELYTAPFIWIPADKCRIVPGKNGKATCYDKFDVEHMAVDNGRITELVITLKGNVVFTMGKQATRKPQKASKKLTEQDPIEQPQPNPIEQAQLKSAKQSAWNAIKTYAATQGIDPKEVAQDFTESHPEDTYEKWQYGVWFYTALDAIAKYARKHHGDFQKMLDGVRIRNDYRDTAEFWNAVLYEFME